MSDYGKELLCRVIYVLLSDETIQTRLANAHCHLVLLKFFSDAIPREIWDDFSALVNELIETFGEEGPTRSNNNLTFEQEMALTERLLSIYVGISGGNLLL
jgi:hypothetical protein